MFNILDDVGKGKMHGERVIRVEQVKSYQRRLDL